MERIDSIKIRVTRKKDVREDYDLIEMLSPNLIRVVSLKNKKEGVIDAQGNLVIPCEYSNVWSFKEGMFSIKKDNLCGYADEKGNVVIPCIYKHSYSFDNEVAEVQREGVKVPIIIDKTGKETLFDNNYDKTLGFKEGLNAVCKDNLWGFVDKTGKEVISCKYSKVNNFKEGLAAVCKNDLWGFVDKTGKEVITCKYNKVNDFKEGLALVSHRDKKGNIKYGFINKKGKKAMAFLYDEAWEFEEGLAAVCRKKSQEEGYWNFEEYCVFEECWGFIDKKGRRVIPCIYGCATGFKEGLALVQKKEGWGFIDKTGKEVIPCIYDYGDDFSEGLALVEKDKLWGYINKNGEVVLPLIYDEVSNFENGIAMVSEPSYNKEWYIDKTGKKVDRKEAINAKYASMINYNKEITEELYIKNEKDIPKNCISIEILSYNSKIVLSDGSKVVVSSENKEEWKRKVKEISSKEMLQLENNIKNNPLTKKLIK